jgi:hypothetical protein
MSYPPLPKIRFNEDRPSYIPRPKISFNDEDPLSCNITAQLQYGGMIRLHSAAAYMSPKDVREFAIELLGLADFAELIYREDLEDDGMGDESDNRGMYIPPF